MAGNIYFGMTIFQKLLEETILPFASHAYKLDQSPSVEVELDVNPIEMSGKFMLLYFTNVQMQLWI